MNGFVHEAAAVRVVFGERSLDRVPAEVAALDRHRALVIAGGSAAGHGDRLAASLGARAAGRFDRVAPHVPEPLVARGGGGRPGGRRGRPTNPKERDNELELPGRGQP